MSKGDRARCACGGGAEGKRGTRRNDDERVLRVTGVLKQKSNESRNWKKI